MPYLNRYTFVGNLTKAPELRLPPTDEKQALCILNVAINRNSRDEQGERKTQTTYINDIEVWGHTAEACAHFLTPGSMVLVEGRMDVDQWQDKQSGARRSRMKVVAENVQFLRIKRAGDEPGQEPVASLTKEEVTAAPRRPRRRAPGSAVAEA
jgi:single-strand DNA-binding protein